MFLAKWGLVAMFPVFCVFCVFFCVFLCCATRGNIDAKFTDVQVQKFYYSVKGGVVVRFERSLNYDSGQLMGGSGGCEHAKVETLENEKVALIFEGV